jgi:hypothetical protein
MRLHDGELDAVASEQAERRLGWDASGRRYLNDLERIGDGVRDALRLTTPSADLTDQIMARIEQSQKPEGFAPRPAWQRRVLSLGIGLGSTAALAALAVLWLSGTVSVESNDVRRAADTNLRASSASVEVSSDVSPGVAIESVDFGGGGGSIFLVQAGRETTPVVWLSEPPQTEVKGEAL